MTLGRAARPTVASGHHLVTRQPAYATLRATAFAHLSAQFPTASRKHRRAAARLAARGLVAEAKDQLVAPERVSARSPYGTLYGDPVGIAAILAEAGDADPGHAPGGDRPR